MSVSRWHTTPGLPQLSFLNKEVQKESRLKLLGVSFDNKRSYGYHIHRTAIRETQRLHFLRKAAVVLCTRGRAVVYVPCNLETSRSLQTAPCSLQTACHAVCRLRRHHFNELHALVCFGETTSKKTERIVMIL